MKKKISELTKERMVNLIKSISKYSKIKMNDDVKHFGFLCKYASHLYSPYIIRCSVCEELFITDEEISDIKVVKVSILKILNQGSIPILKNIIIHRTLWDMMKILMYSLDIKL